MEILEAFDLLGSYRSAAELAGCSHHTVERYVTRRDQGRDSTSSMPRPKVADEFQEKIAEWVTRSKGKIRADVVHEKLQAMGYPGSERTTRRAVAQAKKTHGAENRRVFRPWITEPGGWLQFDWGQGPAVQERGTSLFCAWLAWSRFRVVIPTWDRTLATTLACLDETFHRLGGVPTYVLTDNEKTVTCEHVAGIPVRHPQIAACGRHYGTKIVTCVPADPQSKGGSEAAVRVAKADLVPTDSNLAGDYRTFACLRQEVQAFCEKVNARPHRATGRPPADMLLEELPRLHPVPATPYLAALGETRVVNRSSVISLGGTRYSVPHHLIEETVFCRLEGDEVVIAHNGPNGVCEVARHRRALPGNPRARSYPLPAPVFV